MKNFLFHNDKSTINDELLLLLFIVACIAVGVLLFAFAPTDWIVPHSTIKIIGLIWVIAGIMFIPGFVIRLLENKKESKK